MNNINQAQWVKAVADDANAVILDVRTPGECAEGLLKDAIQLDIQHTAKFIQTLDSLDKSKNYYVYCRSGGRSGQACMLMGAKGFQTYNLVGGILAWTGELHLP